MKKNYAMQREIARVPHFSLGVVEDVDSESGLLNARTGDRDTARTGLGIVAQPVKAGATALMLAGGENDQASVIGYAPFMGG